MNPSRNAVSFKAALTRPRGELTRLYHQARENEARLVDDLDIAREVQQQLVSRGNLAFPGLDLAAECVPARELGGDFYDFLPYGNGRLALALGDVCGKGTAAALLGALTIGILRAHTVDHRCAPAQLLATLNERINAARLNARFVAMLFAVFDSNARQLTIANAGNPYPLLVHEGRIEEIPLTGIPLGLVPGTKYEPVSLDLQSGDTLLFVSDGILECQSSKREAFGIERLAAVLTSLPSDTSADEISSAILSATDVFSCQASAQRDDRSLIVLRVTEDSSANLPRVPVIY
jgi:sigma-B regulation protein RsbU (phosphoserine phosphatase)